MQSTMKDKINNFFNEGVSKISRNDVNKAIASEDAILKIARKLKGLWEDSKTLVSMLKDYKNGSYKKIPGGLIAAATLGLLYVLSPVDFIPDAIPVLGLTDDALVLSLVFAGFSAEIESYRKWKHCGATNNNSNTINI